MASASENTVAPDAPRDWLDVVEFAACAAVAARVFRAA